MSKWNWALLTIVYIGTLIVIAPAGLLSPIAGSASNSRAELANSRGTIWHGAANIVLHQRSGGLIILPTLHWDIALLPLLSGKLSTQIKWDDEAQTVPMQIVASTSQVEFHNAYVPLPAVLLDEVSDFLKPVQLRGKIILRSESLQINKQGLQGTTTADWLNASSLLSNISPLGNYHFTFAGSSNNNVNISLSTTSGALILAGQGRISSSTGLDFKGTAQAASGKEEVLKELLNHLGPEERPGVKTFTLVPTPAH